MSRNEVQVSCAALDEEGPEITAISYTLNSGSPRTGVCLEPSVDVDVCIYHSIGRCRCVCFIKVSVDVCRCVCLSQCRQML